MRTGAPNTSPLLAGFPVDPRVERVRNPIADSSADHDNSVGAAHDLDEALKRLSQVRGAYGWLS